MAQGAEYLGSYTWRSDVHGFGGFSALMLEGDALTVVSDRGAYMTARVQRDADGAISGIVEPSPLTRFVSSDGGRLRSPTSDAEAITRTPDGTIYIAFEGLHRVMRHDTLGPQPSQMPQHPEFVALQPNSGLEALASDASGVLYAIPERSGNLARPFPIYRYTSGVWDQPFALPRRGDYLVVGADIGPDGRLYVLERYFALIGFSSRVRSFAIGADGLDDEREELQTRVGRHDNLEGIDVWRDGDGRLRMTLISDDNLRALQRTELVEYWLD